MRERLYDFDWGSVDVEFFNGDAYLHLDQKKFSHNIFKTMLSDFSDILLGFATVGHKYVYSCIPTDDTKTVKFQFLMGLEPHLQTEDGKYTIFRMKTLQGE